MTVPTGHVGHGHVINDRLEVPMQQSSSNPKECTTQTTRRRAMGIRARDEQRMQAAERRDTRQRRGDPPYWDGECELYLGLGGV